MQRNRALGDRSWRYSYASIEIACVAADALEAGREEAARLFGRYSTDAKRAGDLGLRDRTGDIRWTSW